MQANPSAHESKPTVPPRAERVAALRQLMGKPDPSVGELTRAIRRTAYRNYDRYVMPLVQQHWPELIGQGFGKKLRFLTCDLYASAPYSVLFSSPNRPLAIRLATAFANRLPLPNRVLGFGTRLAMSAIKRLAYQHEHRRIVLVAAFIACVDHVFDHCMEDEPVERGRKMHDLLNGKYAPDTPGLALTRAIHQAMSHRLTLEENDPFHAAMVRVHDWIDSEVSAMTGEDDPTGLGFRVAGVEGTIDGLIFPVYRYAGEAARQWMYDVSMFVQLMDDWIDYEVDAAGDRTTPVITGSWKFEDVESMWKGTVSGIEELTRAAGLKAPHYVRFVREAYVLMMHEVADAMIDGIAD